MACFLFAAQKRFNTLTHAWSGMFCHQHNSHHLAMFVSHICRHLHCRGTRRPSSLAVTASVEVVATASLVPLSFLFSSVFVLPLLLFLLLLFHFLLLLVFSSLQTFPTARTCARRSMAELVRRELRHSSRTAWQNMGGCHNCGPFLGTLNIRCRIIIGTQKGTIILTTAHMWRCESYDLF